MKRFDGNINIKTDDVNIKRGWIPVSNVNLPSVCPSETGVLLCSYPLLPWLIINSASTLHTAMYVQLPVNLAAEWSICETLCMSMSSKFGQDELVGVGGRDWMKVSSTNQPPTIPNGNGRVCWNTVGS